MILEKGRLYVHTRDDIRTWVAWFDLRDPSRSTRWPHVGEPIIYLGRGSEIVRGRGPGVRPDSWCFLRGATIVEVYNNSFMHGLDEVEQ